MKRLIAAVILSLFLFTSYFSGYFYIKNTCKKTNELLNDCVAAYEQNSNAAKKIKYMKNFWSDREKKLSLFTNHSNVDDIELSINTLLIYSTSSQKELFYEHSDKIKTLLHQVMEDTVPGAHSIF